MNQECLQIHTESLSLWDDEDERPKEELSLLTLSWGASAVLG